MSFAAALTSPALRTAPGVQALQRTLEAGRLAHSLLLYGPEPGGLEEVATALAAHLLGSSPEKVLGHPDCFTLRPSGKARQIRIGENAREENTARALLHGVQQTPSIAVRKVAVVFEADRMNAATSNAILKTLEEPPADTTLLLLTARPYALLDTIRSRCFHLRLPAGSGETPHPHWEQWRNGYRAWLQRLWERPGGRAAIADLLMGAYGLAARYVAAQAEMAAEAGKAEEADAPLSEDERIALEVGRQKALRRGMLRDIACETHAFALQESPARKAAALADVLAELERVTGLLEVHLREESALEHFLLFSLRTWYAASAEADKAA